MVKRIEAIQRTNGDWVTLEKGQEFRMDTNKRSVHLIQGTVFVHTFRHPLQIRYA